MNPDHSRSSSEVEAAARACLVRYGRVRLSLSRAFENALKPVVSFANTHGHETNGQPQRILVVEYWNLGDFVMLTPFLKNLRIDFPDAHIALLAGPRTEPMASGQQLVNQVIPVRAPWAQHMSRWKKYASRDWINFVSCIRGLRSKRFDLGFTARADVRDNFLLWVAGVRRRVGYGFGYGSTFLTDVVEPDLSKVHYSERWLHLLEYLKKPIADRRPELKLEPEQLVFSKRFLREIGIEDKDIVVGFHPGARNELRQWGAEKFLQVARRLKDSFPIKILWFQEPGETKLLHSDELIPVALPLREFVAVLSACKALVCNDTGPMHMASGLGIPVVAVFGPTQPEWFGPLGLHDRIVIRRDIWCRPCFDYCIFDQPYCLRTVTVEAVYDAGAHVLRSIFKKAHPLEGSTDNLDEVAPIQRKQTRIHN